MATDSTPVRVGLIGAGKFGAMFLSQAPTTPGLEVRAIADLDPDKARNTCRAVGWDAARVAATNFLDRGIELAVRDDIDVIIEATGHPSAGIAHALAAIDAGRHIVMVNVEADVLAGPVLAAQARAAVFGILPRLQRRQYLSGERLVDFIEVEIRAFTIPHLEPIREFDLQGKLSVRD